MLPFTREQFVQVFVDYNQAVWPAAVVAYLVGLGVIGALLRPSRASGRVVGGGLALMWIWSGVVYHGLFFASINRAAVAFDALGMVVGIAVMGKPEERLGDSLEGFEPDLAEATILAHLEEPLAQPHDILGRATTRLVYDLFAYQRSQSAGDDVQPQPAVVYTLARETHDADLAPGQQTKIQHGFSYSDGFGREIQKKMRAALGPIVRGGPEVSPRWADS